MWILAKEIVGKRFFHFFAFYIDIKFHVKVINSLARVLQKLVVIRFFYIWLEVRGEQGELSLVDTNIKHGTFVPKQNHKYPYSFCLKESLGPGAVRRLHEYNLWYFRQDFPNSACQFYWQKVKVIMPTLSKSQQFTIWLASIFSSASST